MKTKRKAVKKFVEPETIQTCSCVTEKVDMPNCHGAPSIHVNWNEDKFIPIRIIRERDYQKLLKLARKGSNG